MLNVIINGQGPEPPDAVHLSGGTVRLIEIMKRLSKEKDVSLYVFSSSGVCRTFVKNGVDATYRVIPFYLNPVSFRSFLDSLLRTIRVSLSSLPTKNGILYSPSDFLWDSIPALIWKLRKRKLKCVICIFLIVPSLFRDYTRSFDKDNRIVVPTSRRLFYYLSQQLTISWGKRWADKIFVLNKMDKDYLIHNKGLAPSRIHVVNGGVDYVYINNLKTKAKLFDAVFLGRFHPQKGIFDLIKIWRIVCEKKPNAKLCLIGSGPSSMTKEVTAAIRMNNLANNIALVGPKKGDEKFLLLKSSAIFVCPSHYESFAIVIAEAMACGLPIVAYDLPIYRDLYEENILKAPLGDLNQFADAVINLLENGDSRETFGIAGKKFVEKYDWGKVTKQELMLMGDLQK